jgi:phage terminase large subunit-like protein
VIKQVAELQVSNPNYGKAAKAKAEVRLTRKERDELEALETARKYQAKHAAGLTEESQKDMARLAVVRKQREEAAAKKKADEAAKAAAKAGR